MSQLALDDDQRDLLVGQLDSVRMAQLMRRKSTPDARCGGGSSQLAARGRLPPSPAGGRTVNHAQQRADGQPDAQLGADLGTGRLDAQFPAVTRSQRS